jgi:hypothetical protein
MQVGRPVVGLHSVVATIGLNDEATNHFRERRRDGFQAPTSVTKCVTVETPSTGFGDRNPERVLVIVA